jgi:hypothetical protein
VPLTHGGSCVPYCLERSGKRRLVGWEPTNWFVAKHATLPTLSARARTNAQPAREHGSTRGRAYVEPTVPRSEPHARLCERVDVRCRRRRVPVHGEVAHAQVLLHGVQGWVGGGDVGKQGGRLKGGGGANGAAKDSIQ